MTTKKQIIMITLAMASFITMGMAQVENTDQIQTRNSINRSNQIHRFDVTTPVNLEGEIVKIAECTQGKGRYAKGLTLTIKNKSGESVVHLGPQRFIDASHWSFKESEHIDMKAYKGTAGDQGKLFAAQVTTNGKTLVLRDGNGIPAWSMGLKKEARPGGKGRGKGPGRNNTRRNCNPAVNNRL